MLKPVYMYRTAQIDKITGQINHETVSFHRTPGPAKGKRTRDMNRHRARELDMQTMPARYSPYEHRIYNERTFVFEVYTIDGPWTLIL